MEFKAKEKFVDHDQKYIESQLFTSIDLEQFKNEPDNNHDNSAMEIKVKAEFKKEFVQDDQGYIESHMLTSIDLGDLKNEIDEDNSESNVMKKKILAHMLRSCRNCL
uniref:Uncharacterized protein LOC114341396 isoform X2 n=1 Tax=Diabrotica virgifera virgifera TaxID=50390 RepID=A0A6P7GVY6_DIAVI